MKLPSSKAYFICQDISLAPFWYGSYDYESKCYSWSRPSSIISNIDFQHLKTESPTAMHPEILFQTFHSLIVLSHPFDLNFIRSYYPEFLI